MRSGKQFEGFDLKQAQSLQQLAQQLAQHQEELAVALSQTLVLADNVQLIWSTVRSQGDFWAEHFSACNRQLCLCCVWHYARHKDAANKSIRRW